MPGQCPVPVLGVSGHQQRVQPVHHLGAAASQCWPPGTHCSHSFCCSALGFGPSGLWGRAFRSSAASRLSSFLGGSALVPLLAFHLMVKVMCPPAGVSGCLCSGQDRRGLVFCLCSSQTWAALKSPSVRAWPQAWLHSHSAQGALLSPGPWSGSWAEMGQIHPCIPALSFLQISPCNVV